jgi:hypothetical protein
LEILDWVDRFHGVKDCGFLRWGGRGRGRIGEVGL